MYAVRKGLAFYAGLKDDYGYIPVVEVVWEEDLQKALVFARSDVAQDYANQFGGEVVDV